jgi:hypothetical protein
MHWNNENGKSKQRIILTHVQKATSFQVSDSDSTSIIPSVIRSFQYN